VTTDQWLKMLRRKLSDVDTAAQRRTDLQLLSSAEDARVELAVRLVQGFDTVAIGLNRQDISTYGIQNASDSQMVILIYAVAHEVLSSTYRERVDRGELGVSWRSGLEEESSISAERAYKAMLEELKSDYNQLLVTYQRTTANARKH
jgi:hypothetical protein